MVAKQPLTMTEVSDPQRPDEGARRPVSVSMQARVRVVVLLDTSQEVQGAQEAQAKENVTCCLRFLNRRI